MNTELITDELKKRIITTQLIAFDFDGVFTDNMVYTFDDGREAVKCSRSEGLGLQKMNNLGIQMVVISTEKNPVVAVRCHKLGLECFHNCQDKIGVLKNIASKRNISLDNVAYVGNDINDISCLNNVGLPIVVSNAHIDVLHLGLYRTSRPGGDGAVREICDLFAMIISNVGGGGDYYGG